jgi:ABC-type sugar transport system permease subunit
MAAAASLVLATALILLTLIQLRATRAEHAGRDQG